MRIRPPHVFRYLEGRRERTVDMFYLGLQGGVIDRPEIFDFAVTTYHKSQCRCLHPTKGQDTAHAYGATEKRHGPAQVHTCQPVHDSPCGGSVAKPCVLLIVLEGSQCTAY